MIEIENLRHVYPNGTTALDGVTLELESGGIRAVLGRSGSGKTTLLMCLGRFLDPTQGRISVDGSALESLEESELRQRLGVVFQSLDLFPHLTVIDNLTLAPRHVLGESAGRALERGMEALERLGISELASSFPAQISGGQAQRVAIARALLLEPDYLLLDEPTAALDVRTSREFGEWLVTLQDVTTFIVVTHDAAFARQTAASGVLLEGGGVVGAGTIEALLEKLDDPGLGRSAGSDGVTSTGRSDGT